MFKFFYDLMVPTEINIQVTISSFKYLDSSSTTFDLKPCHSEIDFQNAYIHINALFSSGREISFLEIKLTGQLNSKKVAIYFDSLDSFREYLEEKSLFVPNSYDDEMAQYVSKAS